MRGPPEDRATPSCRCRCHRRCSAMPSRASGASRAVSASGGRGSASSSVAIRERAFWLLRLGEVPPRLYGTLTRTPGLTLFAPVADNVAVAVGYRHPIHLGACRQALPPHRLFLFAPAPRGVIAVDPAPTLTP